MKKINEKYMILTEATYNYAKFTKNIGYFVIKPGSIPSTLFYSPVGEIKDNDNIIMVNVSTTKLKKFLQEYGKDRTIINAFLKMIWDVNIESLKRYPELFKIINLSGRDKIYKYLTREMKMPESVFIRYFGSVPTEATEGVKFHNANVIFPDSMQISRKKELISLLQAVYELLATHKLAYLFGGTIEFIETNSRLAGYYVISTKVMRIKPRVKKSKAVCYTIIHEFAHKLYYEYFTPAKQHIIKDKFLELIKSGYHRDISNQYEKEKDNLKNSITLPDLRVGTKIYYIGKSTKFKNKIFIITQNTGKTIHAVDQENKRGIKGSLLAFNTTDWGYSFDDIPVDYPETDYKIDKKSDKWFPVQYALKDDEEMFAELFAFYIFDNLSGEPKKWIETLLK